MSFLIYPTIKESPFLSVLGMGGGGTGTAIGGAGPDMSEDFNQNTYYVIIPYYSSAAGGSGNRIALFNPTTGKYAADFETSTSSGKIYRFGDSIVVTAKDRGWYHHYTYNNNWAESSGSFHSSYRGDEVKISSNRLWTLGWQTSSDLTAYIRVYSVTSSGLSNVANYTNTSMGAYNGTYGMIDNPVIGVQANVTASTGILSSINNLHIKAPDGNSSNAHERRSGVVFNNYSTGGFTKNNHSSSGNNYSRPIAGTGWDGYCYTSGMDGARTWVTNSGGSSTWSGFSCTPPTNGFHGVGVLGISGRFITIVNSGGTHYFSWVTTSGTQHIYAIPTTSGATVQQYPNGCATCDYDSSANKIRVRIYNSSTSAWSTMYAATEFPPLNMLNYNYRKIITY